MSEMDVTRSHPPTPSRVYGDSPTLSQDVSLVLIPPFWSLWKEKALRRLTFISTQAFRRFLSKQFAADSRSLRFQSSFTKQLYHLRWPWNQTQTHWASFKKYIHLFSRFSASSTSKTSSSLENVEPLAENSHLVSWSETRRQLCFNGPRAATQRLRFSTALEVQKAASESIWPSLAYPLWKIPSSFYVGGKHPAAGCNGCGLENEMQMIFYLKARWWGATTQRRLVFPFYSLK